MIDISVFMPELGNIHLPTNLHQTAQRLSAAAQINISRAYIRLYDEPIDGNDICITTDSPDVSPYAVRWNLAGLTVSELHMIAMTFGQISAEAESAYSVLATVYPMNHPGELLEAAAGYRVHADICNVRDYGRWQIETHEIELPDDPDVAEAMLWTIGATAFDGSRDVLTDYGLLEAV